MQLTDEKRQAVAEVARRNGFGEEATLAMLDALMRGNGMQAQFNNPEFGGMGQWSGGMLMIGDMFNNGLKGRVDMLIRDLAALGITASDLLPQGGGGSGGFSGGFSGGWSSNWPAELGAPSSSGSQNGMDYAVFPSTRRLAVRQNGHMSIYDTGDLQIGGVSQQQGNSQTLQFTSQSGPVVLENLIRISG
ncbi:hypothetical protein [uncultured Paracoccus sp.]|uniref:hypothetical protein n=1 Tax=uncultured Paracoccus sp. TaxID=189685 RepID=UPI0025EE797C|nr:hypothetical protein [uncultured Paracoccus sp.]